MTFAEGVAAANGYGNGTGAGAAAGPVKTPFLAPYPGCQPEPSAPLTAEQESKYRELLATVSAWTTLPTSSSSGGGGAAAKGGAAAAPPSAEITDDERMFLSHECLLRYLRATKWNSAEAPRRLLATLVWRREFGAAARRSDEVEMENETGKQVILGYDVHARPCIYLRPSRQNTKRSERQIQHLVFMLERVIDLMVPGQGTMAIMIDFKDSNSSSNPSVAQGRQVLGILQGHYPERLGRAMIKNVPWPVWGFFKLISPFIDPLTREKMKFNEDLRQHVPPAQLWTVMGGDVQFEYEHAVYWPALIALAAERRAAYRERWVRGGKRVGEYEAYLKGGAHNSLAEEEEGKAVASAASASRAAGTGAAMLRTTTAATSASVAPGLSAPAPTTASVSVTTPAPAPAPAPAPVSGPASVAVSVPASAPAPVPDALSAAIAAASSAVAAEPAKPTMPTATVAANGHA